MIDYNRACPVCDLRWTGAGPVNGEVAIQACDKCAARMMKKPPEMSFKTVRKRAAEAGEEYVPLGMRKPRPGFEVVKTKFGYRWKKL